MALTVEDGSGVVGANSYIDVATAQAYATARGVTLPSEDADVEVLLVKAMDYIESLRNRYQGERTYTSVTNNLVWPRIGVYVDGERIASDVVPQLVKDAQAQLAMDAQNADLMPTGAGREVIRERVEGAVEVEYNPLGITNIQPVLQKAKALLAPLMMTSYLRTVRV